MLVTPAAYLLALSREAGALPPWEVMSRLRRALRRDARVTLEGDPKSTGIL